MENRLVAYIRADPHKLLIAMIVLLSLILRFSLSLCSRFTQEDAFITLRFADNIAAGRGFVYNSGERVLGTTTPLYTLLLAAADRLGLPALTTGKALCAVADSCLCLVVYLLLGTCSQKTAGLIAAFLIAINPIEMRVAISGQESSLVALCGALSWLYYAKRDYYTAYVWCAILFLLRWDGLLLIFVMTAAIAVRQRQVPWKELLLCAAICAPWLLFATVYFGNPIPVTLASKAIVYGWYFQNQAFPELGGIVERLIGTPGYCLMTVLVIIGVLRTIRERLFLLLPLAIWFTTYWLAFLISKVVLFEWYFVPSLYVYMLFAALGVAMCMEPLKSFINLPWRSVVAATFAVLLAFSSFRDTLTYTNQLQRLEDQLRKPVGVWLRLHSDTDDSVMLEPIGYIGYFSRLKVIDMTGLVTPSVLPYYNHTNPCPWLLIAYAKKPDWCVFRPDEASLLLRTADSMHEPWDTQYKLVKTFSYPAQLQSSSTEFDIYRRIYDSSHPSASTLGGSHGPQSSLTPTSRQSYTKGQN